MVFLTRRRKIFSIDFAAGLLPYMLGYKAPELRLPRFGGFFFVKITVVAAISLLYIWAIEPPIRALRRIGGFFLCF
jgi:hypothetical protein